MTTLSIQQAAQLALEVQDACNLSGVAYAFAEKVLPAIWNESRQQNKGTDFVNSHPIVTLFLDKLASLNGHSINMNFAVYDAVAKLAQS
jgi:hypothetical protein